MRNKRTRLALLGVLALALSVTAGLTVSAEAAKKKKKGNVSFSQSKAVNLPILNFVANPATPLRSDITLGSKFKGKVISDVNVTFQTTGTAAGAADDLTFKLHAPNGRTVLVAESLGDISIGPLTFDDDTRTQICDVAVPPCVDPDATLNRPFVGRANLSDDDDDQRPLATFNGVPMKGTWTLTVYDSGDATTSALNQWGIELKGVTAPK